MTNYWEVADGYHWMSVVQRFSQNIQWHKQPLDSGLLQSVQTNKNLPKDHLSPKTSVAPSLLRWAQLARTFSSTCWPLRRPRTPGHCWPGASWSLAGSGRSWRGRLWSLALGRDLSWAKPRPAKGHIKIQVHRKRLEFPEAYSNSGSLYSGLSTRLQREADLSAIAFYNYS